MLHGLSSFSHPTVLTPSFGLIGRTPCFRDCRLQPARALTTKVRSMVTFASSLALGLLQKVGHGTGIAPISLQAHVSHQGQESWVGAHSFGGGDEQHISFPTPLIGFHWLTLSPLHSGDEWPAL